MDRLTNAEELLDGPLDDPAALAGNLRDLRRINRVLGGVRLSRLAVDRLLNAAPTHLDAARSRSSTSARAAPTSRSRCWRTRAAAAGRWRSSPIDTRPEVLDAARASRPALDAPRRASTLDVSDGRSLPYPDRAFDIAHASLVIHHLEPGRGRRVARARWPASPASGSSSTTWTAAGCIWLGCLAHRPPVHAEPLHPPRRAAVRPPRLHAARDARAAAPSRAAPGRPSSAGSSATATRSRRSGRDRRRRDRRRRSGRGGPRRSARAARPRRRPPRAVARRIAGGPAASSARRPRSTRFARPGSTTATLAAVARPVPAMRVETAAGTTLPADVRRRRLARALRRSSFDRAALDPALLDLARARRGGRPARDGGHRRRAAAGSSRVAPDGETALDARVDRRRRRDPLDGRPGVRRRPVAAARAIASA